MTCHNTYQSQVQQKIGDLWPWPNQRERDDVTKNAIHKHTEGKKRTHLQHDCWKSQPPLQNIKTNKNKAEADHSLTTRYKRIVIQTAYLHLQPKLLDSEKFAKPADTVTIETYRGFNVRSPGLFSMYSIFGANNFPACWKLRNTEHQEMTNTGVSLLNYGEVRIAISRFKRTNRQRYSGPGIWSVGSIYKIGDRQNGQHADWTLSVRF